MRTRYAQAADLDAIIAIHTRALPDFFLTNMGPRFLRAYYTTVLYGLAQRASDGESRQTLLKVAAHAMDAWTGLAEAAGNVVSLPRATPRGARARPATGLTGTVRG